MTKKEITCRLLRLLDSDTPSRSWPVPYRPACASQVELYTYNWPKEKWDHLHVKASDLGQWTNARCSLLHSIVAQKLGLFHHQPFTRRHDQSTGEVSAAVDIWDGGTQSGGTSLPRKDFGRLVGRSRTDRRDFWLVILELSPGVCSCVVFLLCVTLSADLLPSCPLFVTGSFHCAYPPPLSPSTDRRRTSTRTRCRTSCL